MNEKSIEGKWQTINLNHKEYEAGKLVFDESQTCIESYFIFNFKSDGTGLIIDYNDGELENPDTYQIVKNILAKL